MTRVAHCRLREATDRDAPTVFALLANLGLRLPNHDTGRSAMWRRLWIENPALRGDDRPPPGWVLEADGMIVGFFGSILREGVVGGRTVRIAVASLWGVQPGFRDHVPELAGAYFGQERADVSLVTTAVLATARIFERHGGQAVPQPNLGNTLSWVIDVQGFVAAALRRKGVGGNAATFSGKVSRKLGMFASTPLHRSVGTLPDVAILGIPDLGGEFDGLWRRVAESRAGFWAVRNAAALRWHFESNDSAVVFALRGANGLDGYTIVVRDDNTAIGLRRLRIADLVISADDAEKTTTLLAAAFAHADTECCHVLELVGLTAAAYDHARTLEHFST